jgi:DNA invertase Pin-like site-specific DNA recombinase
MKVFAYYRVSTDMQEDALKSQKMACEGFAKGNGLEIVKEFSEIGSAHSERPIFDSMLNELKDVKGVLVTDLDRLTRDALQFAKLLNVFQTTGKQFFTTIGNINLDSAEDVLLARIRTDIGEYETKKLRERMKRGIKRYKEETGSWGRPKKAISKRIFKTFIQDGKLMVSKASLCYVFSVSYSTLHRWMRENNYGHLINERPEWFE